MGIFWYNIAKTEYRNSLSVYSKVAVKTMDETLIEPVSVSTPPLDEHTERPNLRAGTSGEY